MASKLRLSLTVILLITISLSTTAIKPALAQGKVVIVIQPTVASDEMLTKAKPLQATLEKSFGGRTKVEVDVPTSYAAVVESLRFGHAQVEFILAQPLGCRWFRTTSQS